MKGFTVAGDQSKSISFKAYAGDQSKYIEYVYTLKGNDYLVGFTLNTVGLQDVIAASTKKLELNWEMKLPKQELSYRNTTKCFHYLLYEWRRRG